MLLRHDEQRSIDASADQHGEQHGQKKGVDALAGSAPSVKMSTAGHGPDCIANQGVHCGA